MALSGMLRKIGRRDLIAGASASAAVVVADAIIKPLAAQAADGDAITVGGSFEGTGSTTLHTTGTGQTAAFRGVSDTTLAGYGLDGEAHSESGYGVHGRAYGDQGIGMVGESFYQLGKNGIGVMGWARHPSGETKGVWGLSESPLGTGVVGSGGTGVSGGGITGVQGSGSAQGVFGQTDSATGTGIFGRANLDNGANHGVWGTVRSPSGVGVLAENQNGGAGLQVVGKALFGRSGKVTIAYPSKSATVSVLGSISTSSFALAMLQTDLSGVYVRATTLNAGSSGATLTIFLNRPPGKATAPKSVDVGWFIVN